MGFYEPVVLLALLCGIYAATCILKPRTKTKFLWWVVVSIIIIGAAGATVEILRTGTLSAPSLED